jgi:hypothetical protein
MPTLIAIYLWWCIAVAVADELVKRRRERRAARNARWEQLVREEQAKFAAYAGLVIPHEPGAVRVIKR